MSIQDTLLLSRFSHWVRLRNLVHTRLEVDDIILRIFNECNSALNLRECSEIQKKIKHAQDKNIKISNKI